MMLLNMNELLKVAKENHFAVGAFNVCDSVLLKTVIETAEANNAPVIVELAPPEVDFVGDEFFQLATERLRNAKVPAVLHLDHGKTVEDCVRAIRNGFTSVMIDGSELSYEENIALTQRVVEIAHAVNVSVEAEIGTIGAMSDSVEGGVENITYTKPEEVEDFSQRTGLDSLAIAIGTAHGIYPTGFVPELKLEVLDAIHQLTPDLPLVLHGGSSNKDEEIHQACLRGINKVNIASDYRKAFFSQLEKTLNEKHLFWTADAVDEAMKEAKKVITHKMQLFDCIGKADLYK
ncbi:ketose-bisphosphate aldolase [Dielma fastidiosa]|uniref:Ketose-bisphosphate aldolase n=1 Tax=Dielma fastidiosa TaxID=1034346 RepID=A0AB35UUW7_9FIRM|nr:ketose-bisphosphate aldolase [Dielma fastidiosa]MDY5169737.1 ketose-bisphosphate aldolase [Dielma fastidiosa]